MNDWWAYILRQEGRDELGELLAKHPRAAARTKRLATDLTVTKLVRIANSEYNYSRLGRDIPSDLEVVARSEMAWSILDVKTRTLKMRPGTAWTRTIALLSSEGSDEALARTRDLPIDRFMVACERLIKGPYTAMTKSGGLTRW
jgi:hypothetical protein